jgi:hypothetical protein
VVVGSSSSISVVVVSDVAISTHDPPCEQWLVSMEAGAGFSFGWWWLGR